MILLSAFVAVCLSAGCSGRPGDQPPLAPVSGTVTLDGKPVEGKQVVFAPETEGMRASIATTDAEGHYRLMYTNKWEGAIIGPHKVTVFTPVPARDGIPYNEDIPASYNVESTLTANVEDTNNVINWDLKSQ